MKIYGIDAPEFAEFGKVLEGYDTAPLLDALNKSTPSARRNGLCS